MQNLRENVALIQNAMGASCTRAAETKEGAAGAARDTVSNDASVPKGRRIWRDVALTFASAKAQEDGATPDSIRGTTAK